LKRWTLLHLVHRVSQDLSVAGKQLGIHEGQRSNLFFEAIRIIKEMRNATSDKFPRFAVWENVPGAFSSNKGEDFRAVLRAFAEIGEKGSEVSVPFPEKGKWLPAGTVVGNGWSLAWRVYDAQFWGVPQRRKRIYLIADFGSERAGEILFKPEGVSGHPEPGGEKREGTSGDAEGSAGRSNQPICLNFQGNKSGCCTTDDGTSYSLNAMHGHDVHVVVDSVNCLNPWEPAAFMGGQGAKARSIAYCDDGSTPTIKSAPSGGNTVPDVVYPINTMVATRGGKDDMRTCFGVGEKNDPQFTLSAAHEHAVCYAPSANHCGGYTKSDKSATLCTKYHYGSGGDAAMAVYNVENHPADSRIDLLGGEKPVQTLTSRMGTGGGNVPMILMKEKDDE